MALLELCAVHKSFGTGPGRTEVLRDIHLQIHEGEFIAIVGYSGAGKTTLLSLLAGLTKPDHGSVTLDGRQVAGPGPDRGVVFQNYSLLPWLSVRENIQLAVDAVFPGRTASARGAQIDRYVEMVGLANACHKRPSELSGGMRQRVSLARALACEPRVLLMDEPLGALDALTRANLQDEILRIWSGEKRTVVLITNDVDEGLLMADRIIPLGAGPAAALGPSVQIDIPRPRDRRSISHHEGFKNARRCVLAYLLGPGGRPKTDLTHRLILPDILPEDLSVTRPSLLSPLRPRRRGETRVEKVQI